MAAETAGGGMKRTLSLTGITVNAMALIAPGAFLWTTFQMQSSQVAGGAATAPDMWTGLVFALVLAFLTAYAYSELARIYPNAGTGSSYYFAEAALLDKEKPQHRKWARTAKLSIGWISHLYYWVYPGIMVAFTATLAGYIWTTFTGQTLSFPVLAIIAIVFALVSGAIAYRGISGSTNTAIAINVIQLTAVAAFTIFAIYFRLSHPASAAVHYEAASSAAVFLPHSFINIIYQSTIAILLLVGFESVTALGAEAINPEKDIKRGILLSLGIQGIAAYLFQYFAANFVVGSATLQGKTAAGKAVVGYAAAALDGAPIGTMVKTMVNTVFGGGGTAVAIVLAASVLLALIGTTLSCLNAGVRITYSMARDKEVPSLLGLLHGKYATPHAGIWVLAILSAALGVYGVYSVDALMQITLASNTGTFLVYGMSCLVTIAAFAGRKDRSVFKHYVIPALGALMNLAELAGVVYLAVVAGGTTSSDAYVALAIVGAWIAAGVVWVALNPAQKGVKLLDPQAAHA
jgi:amino acid transporter